jgi:type VI secretion system protein ImpH
LFYRGYANTQPVVSFDRPSSDRFAKYVGAQFGMGMRTLCDRDDIPDRLRLFFAGVLASQTRNADGLSAILQEYFGLRIRIQQFVGEWVDIPKASRWRIGGPGGGTPLGKGTALGRRALICQSRFRVVVGPVSAEQLERFLPGGASLPRLAAVVHDYVGDQLGWDLMLVLDATTARPWALGGPNRLGSTCWLGKSPRQLIVKPPPRQVAPARGADSHGQAPPTVSATGDPRGPSGVLSGRS